MQQSMWCYVSIRLNENHDQLINSNQSVKNNFSILFSPHSRCFDITLTDKSNDINLIKCYFLLRYLICFKPFDGSLIATSNPSLTHTDQLEKTTFHHY